jgi:hypothetical protein
MFATSERRRNEATMYFNDVVSDNKIIYFTVLTHKNEEQEEVKLYVLLSISIVMTRFS